MARRYDPVLMEVMKHELAAISEEMAIAVSRTGRSPMMRIGDFGVAICDAQGRFFDSGYTSPVQLTTFTEAMGTVVAKWPGTLDAGDVVLLNDPYSGMGHMPDTAVVGPIFWDSEIIAYAIAYSHHTDTGGRYPGGFSSQAASSYEEGLRIPPLKLFQRGELNQQVLDLITANVRTAGDWVGDIEAKIAGLHRGDAEVQAVLAKYGVEIFRDCCEYLMEASEKVTRASIAQVPDGRYVATGLLTDDGFGRDAALDFKLTIIVDGDRMALDFTGCCEQVPSAINCPFGMTKGMAFSALKMVVGADAVMNDGYIRAIEVIVPTGTIVNPSFPAAVGGRAPVSVVVSQLVMEAMAKALPDKVPIMGEGGDVMHFSGVREDGRTFSMMDMFFGGWGGRPNKDGIDGVAMMMFGSYGVTPAEVLEREFPLMVEDFTFVPDSAGPGRHRGSVAVRRQWRFLGEGHVMIRNSHPGETREGLLGGLGGSRSCSMLNPDGDAVKLPPQTHYHIDIKPGDVLRHSLSGSAGHGAPWDRDPALVALDVRDGKLGIEAAEHQYGAVIHPVTGAVRDEETMALRAGASRKKAVACA